MGYILIAPVLSVCYDSKRSKYNHKEGYKMKQNMGAVDRIIRTFIALIIFVLLLTKGLSGIAAIILGIIAVIFLLTSIIGFCPLYIPLKISTKKK